MDIAPDLLTHLSSPRELKKNEDRHFWYHDAMIPITGSPANCNSRKTVIAVSAFPPDSSSAVESIFQQIRNEVLELDSSNAEHARRIPDALIQGLEDRCNPETRFYLQQLMLCKPLKWRSTTDFYEFGEVLGQGSYAKVRVAWHILTGQKVGPVPPQQILHC